MVDKVIVHPNSTVHGWIKSREIEVAAQERQTATVQQTSDFSQALDQFRQRVYDVSHTQRQKSKAKDQLELEKKKVEKDRDDMLFRRGLKRSNDIIELSDDDGNGTAAKLTAEHSQQTPEPAKRYTKPRRGIIHVNNPHTPDLIDAIKGLRDGVRSREGDDASTLLMQEMLRRLDAIERRLDKIEAHQK